ncbi:hypothetical protein F2Q70_00001765 [Brassica cretica]|uniref:RING-type E3 ubiquitin transferase n=1 Tax=Brassica cretica TaxID=69181 RepID=A0A8S9KYF4_BRACR|nr:hypothetical protein F2Q70_00001765 [Brassica cretica]KAF2598186.1 hypothetical protein F2Q68_00012121 [Brassica cretica]
MLVRESAAEQLEERQNDWADSKSVVVLDFVWNLAFVSVDAFVFVLSSDEKSNTPLRVLIIGYGLQCVMHMFCVCVEYRKRSNRIQSSPYSMEDQYLESGSQRLCIVFLGINVFFVVFYVALACVVGGDEQRRDKLELCDIIKRK